MELMARRAGFSAEPRDPYPVPGGTKDCVSKSGVFLGHCRSGKGTESVLGLLKKSRRHPQTKASPADFPFWAANTGSG